VLTEDLVGLFDRDVFLKLACCDLWNETVEALRIGRAYRLPSTTVKSSARIFERWLPDNAAVMAATARLTAMVEQVPILEDAWAEAARSSAHYADIANLPDIDAGEALLLGIVEALGDPNVLVTGDKRFIGALKTRAPGRHAAVAGRLLSLERCLIAVCEARG
jgi:hypothetical protein